VQPPAEGQETLEPATWSCSTPTVWPRRAGLTATGSRAPRRVHRTPSRNGQAAPETLRLLREAIIGSGTGALRDDATALLLEWRRGTQRVVVPTRL